MTLLTLTVIQKTGGPCVHYLRAGASLGACIREVQHTSGLTLKEFCAELGKDERQIARQIDGSDRPQLEAVFAVEKFRGPLVIALARLAADVDVVTEIRVKRSA